MNREYEALHLIKPILIKLVNTVLTKPPTPTDDAGRVKIFKWELLIKEFIHEERLLKEGAHTLWSLIIVLYLDLIKTKIKALADFEQIEKNKDCTWLLQNILKICNKVKDIQNLY